MRYKTLNLSSSLQYPVWAPQGQDPSDFKVTPQRCVSHPDAMCYNARDGGLCTIAVPLRAGPVLCSITVPNQVLLTGLGGLARIQGAELLQKPEPDSQQLLNFSSMVCQSPLSTHTLNRDLWSTLHCSMNFLDLTRLEDGTKQIPDKIHLEVNRENEGPGPSATTVVSWDTRAQSIWPEPPWPA